MRSVRWLAWVVFTARLDAVAGIAREYNVVPTAHEITITVEKKVRPMTPCMCIRLLDGSAPFRTRYPPLIWSLLSR